jgi:uncharacterized protein DUF4440
MPMELHHGLLDRTAAIIIRAMRLLTGMLLVVAVPLSHLRAYGDTAVAAGSSQSSVTLNGQPQGGALHFTRVYVKRNGAWRMIVTQATQRQ